MAELTAVRRIGLAIRGGSIPGGVSLGVDVTVQIILSIIDVKMLSG